MAQIDLDRSSGVCEPGVHTFLIENVEDKEGPKGPYITVHLRCVDEGADRGKMVWHNVSLTPQSRFKVDELLDAVGAPDTGQINTAQLVNKYVRAQIYHEEYQGKPQDKVNSMMPAAPNFVPSQSTTPPVTTTTMPTPTAPELSSDKPKWDIPF